MPVALAIAGVGALVGQFFIDHGKLLHLGSQASLLPGVAVLALAGAGVLLTLGEKLRVQRRTRRKSAQSLLGLPPDRSRRLRSVREASRYEVGAEVPPGKLLCPADWLKVPSQLRRAIYRAAGEDGEGVGTAAHEAACRRAVGAIGGQW
jgi:hypothetical protein